jgi:hypothetical protein
VTLGRSLQLEELANEETLSRRLQDSLHRRANERISVGVAYKGLFACASVGQLGSEHGTGTNPRMKTGCIAKLLTAEIAQRAICEGRFDQNEKIGKLLPEFQATGVEWSDEITVRQLLNHTHGLDDSSIDGAPRLAGGAIDVSALCSRLRGIRPLAPPGKLYSYGNAGFWLLAAIAERAFGVSYSELVAGWSARQVLRESSKASALDPLGESASVCPSTGGTLSVSMRGMLRFLLTCAPSVDGVDEAADTTELPGWSSQELGVHHGWKVYASGWLGHNSAVPGAAGLVRVLPSAGLALAITSADHALSNAFARIFGHLAPELVRLSIPKPLAPAESAALDLDQYVGVYSTSSVQVAITRQDRRALRLAAYHRDASGCGSEPIVCLDLLPARDNVFFTVPTQTELFPFIQFIDPGATGFGYFWNGRGVWPRIKAARQDMSLPVSLRKVN